MLLVSFKEMMEDAARRRYAVGYFESCNLEPLQAVCEAAEETRSPVIVGFSGRQVPDLKRAVPEELEPYAAMGLAFCRLTSVPTAFIFNGSPSLNSIKKAIDLGFNIIRSGLDKDALLAGKVAVKNLVREKMFIFGSP